MTRWQLATATGYYTVSLAPGGVGLVLDHWGPDADAAPWTQTERSSFGTAPDAMPLEYAAIGTRQVEGAELIVTHDDGLTGARPKAAPEVRYADDGTVSRLEARFDDVTGRISWLTVLESSRAHDVVRKWVEIENTGSGSFELSRAFSGAWEVPVGPGARIDYLGGRWAQEFTRFQASLPAGELSLGSRQGITSHTFSPVVTVSRTDESADTSASFAVALAWSGSWRMLVDAVPFRDRVRISGGVDDESNVITLQPGERFVSPEMLGISSPDGPAGIQHRWHDYQRSVLARSTGLEHRPIVYNSWYATEFDVNLEHQSRLADVAARVGAEIFVVDDGWFVGRNSDTAGLGDWTPDPTKFPDGLDPLITAVIDRGMRFGLWVEPEAVNPDSDLYRAHPDWIYRAGDRELVTCRNQYVLDFGRDDVVEWAMEMLRSVLADRRISYLKWDMNRPVSDGGRPGDPHGREWSVQHARGYYRVMRMLREEFPHVTVEACSGGGGRIDNAVLGLTDVVWTSDETGPRDRLAIQDGFLTAYPASVMSSWVTDEPDRLDLEPASFEFRFLVAMAGVLGIGSDLLQWDELTQRRAAELVRRYREIREVVHTGLVVAHGRPVDPVYALEYAGDQLTCLLVYGRSGRPTDVRLAPRTLSPTARYRLRGTDRELTGEQAAEGIEVPFALASDADIVILDRVG
ncbi:alpha-galactosidase [Microlunatus panaciterrae]|uniref:Alpha-galactosidase n=1 Tax=Microlunatus panaciterrae TaxID=400768 RepID=A0ABS2RFY3_9ACTN|nr:alpha-galactosidase [Microlunatus panaciterrae]MBM7797904.1 alpha-galactosidase [Microlunatus panaciterrae]